MKDQYEGLVNHLLTGGISLGQATEVLERSMIQGALARHGGNQSAAARALDIHRNTLLRKMLEYGLATARPRARRKSPGRAANSRAKRAGAA